MLEGTRAPTDAELISGVRQGDLDAYGELFSRHSDAALRLARQLTRGTDAEDLVSEAFTKVMGVLTDGGGPDIAFRAYLLTAVRRLYVDRVRKDSRLTNSGDMTAFDPGVPFQDPVVSEFESSAAARAFATLPERWQLVLWHLEVENQKPADIAPLLGMSRNSVCALAYRAREGLRQAFLTEHLAETTDVDCRWTVEHLSGYVRKALAKRNSAKVKAHLDSCRSCTAMHLELTEVNSNLRGIIAPLLLGAAAAGYLGSGGAGLSALVVLLGRARDALLGATGTSAGTTTGATVGTSAVAAGGAGAGTTAATATAGAAAATTAGATTAAATTAAGVTAGVTAGGAVSGVAAGTTAGALAGAAAAGAATGVTAGVTAAGYAMVAVGTAALTLGVGGTPQDVATAMPMTVQSTTTLPVAPEPEPVTPAVETADPAPAPAAPPPPNPEPVVQPSAPEQPAPAPVADEPRAEVPSEPVAETPPPPAAEPVVVEVPEVPAGEVPVEPEPSPEPEPAPEPEPSPEPAPEPAPAEEPTSGDVSTADHSAAPPKEDPPAPTVEPVGATAPPPPAPEVAGKPDAQPVVVSGEQTV